MLASIRGSGSPAKYATVWPAKQIGHFTMSNDYILAIDSGTQSVRALVFDL